MIFPEGNKMNVSKKNAWTFYPISFLAILLFSIVFRVLIFEIYSIPSDSMEDTIQNGDKVLVNKLSYGPRLPYSPLEIPWINLAFSFGRNKGTKTDSIWWKYIRLPGLTRIKHNHIIVFNSPKRFGEALIKRCIGLPGDTLLIRGEKIYANRQEIPMRGTTKLMSRIIFNNYAQAHSLLDSLDLDIYHNRPGMDKYINSILNENQIKLIGKYKFIDSVIIEKNRRDTAYRTFPGSSLFKWSIDNFGPLVIPVKGMKVKLEEKNYLLYRATINRFENSKINEINGNYYIDGIKSYNYTFKYNYYFMLGDNRHVSNDSRYWGFVPEQYIIGKAFLILFSNGEEGLRWRRLFKIIK
jgi:signal peptidase I